MLLSGSSSQYAMSLGIRVFLKDQFSRPVNNMAVAMRGFEKEFAAFQDTIRATRNIATAIAAGSGLLLSNLASAVEKGADFMYIMKGVQAITDATNALLEETSQLAISIGRETMFTPEQIASGMRFMAMAGQSIHMIQRMIPAATSLAGATMTRLEGKMGAADILTNALKAFGQPAEKSPLMADILTKAATSANVTLVDLGNSIRYVAATTRNLRVPIAQVISGLMSLGNAGIQSSMAGTALENAYRYLSNSLSSSATHKARAAWQKLGLSKKELVDRKGDLLPLADILEKIKDSLQGFGSVDVQNILKDIFGVRGQRAAATLLNNLEEYRHFATMLSPENVRGTAQKKMNLMMDSLKGQILKFTSAIQGLHAVFAKAVSPMATFILKGLTTLITAISDFMNTPIGAFFANVTVAVVGLVAAVSSLTAVFMGLKFLLKSFVIDTQKVIASIEFLTLSSVRNSYIARGAALAPSSVFNLEKTAKAAGYKPTGFAAPYSQFYGPKHRFMRNIKVKPLQLGAAALTTTSRLTRVLGSLGRVVGGVLSFLTGPWGIAISAGMMFLPTIIEALSSNSSAITENTKAIKEASQTTKMRDLFLLTRDMTVGRATQLIVKKLEEAIEANQITAQEVRELKDSEFINYAVKGVSEMDLDETYAGEFIPTYGH